MLKLSLILCILLSFNTFAQNPQEKLEETTLQYIDDICGDSWCEGDFDYSFSNLKCNFKKKTCELDFTFIYADENIDSDKAQYQFKAEFNRNCTLKNISKYKMISKKYQDLNQEFYEKVNDCISEKESDVQDLLSTLIKNY